MEINTATRLDGCDFKLSDGHVSRFEQTSRQEKEKQMVELRESVLR